ncbi:hypothetical protein EKO04_009739 [Ascochyta lentis]|uniref:RING-type domain-containing protein n=1 Tax=Ascochyta lentis TaxID=205686 RepID=A0A8H7IWP7_9PLEO|nr:hypothetical protein EKO04_009739 [Ascochyta lentis]
MPRINNINRCAYKLPNDKYQCQKTGDKLQPHLNLWYCHYHDCHAQDRCQTLIEWAGMGAQCEQLGVWDDELGMKVCEWHGLRGRGDGWPVMENGVWKHVGALGMGADDSESLSWAPLTVSIGEQTGCESRVEDTSMEVDSEQSSPAEEDIVEHETLRNSAEADATTIVPDEDDELPTTVPSTTNTNNLTATRCTCISPPPPNPKQTPVPTLYQVYTDMLPTLLQPRTSSPTLQPPYPNILTSFRPRTSSPIPLDSPIYRQAHPNIFTSLFHPPTNAPRNSAMYNQCCICLELHNSDVMHPVGKCGHRYRELCVKKVVKGGSGEGVRRRYNCVGCEDWVGGLVG